MTVINTANKIYSGSNLASKVYAGTNLVWPAGAPLDSSTQAWVNAVVAAGGSVSGSSSSGRQKLVNDLIIGLKADGIWAKLDRLWLLAGANTQSALIDIKATVQATAVSSPTFTPDRGYAGNASTSYINTGFNATTHAVQFAVNSAHYAIWNNTSRGPATVISLGVDDGTYLNDIFINQAVFANTGFAYRLSVGVGSNSFVSSASQGFFICQQIDGVTTEASYNGASLGTQAIFGSNTLVNLPFFVCGRNNAGVVSSGTTDQISMVAFGGKLTTTEATNYYNRIRTYMTGVGVP